jgi:putative membrane protein
VEEALKSLESVATACLDKAVALKPLPFEIGAATVSPKEFGLKEGMGPGGITVVVIEVGEQRTAYVVFDGNNMVSGLREKILSALRSVGINEGEVFTTDTHSVSAVILNKRGYHPVGEAMEHETLLKHVKDTTLVALSGLKSVKVACNKITVPNVKVIGGKQLEALCLLIDKALQRTKRIIVPLCASVGLLLMLVLTYV